MFDSCRQFSIHQRLDSDGVSSLSLCRHGPSLALSVPFSLTRSLCALWLRERQRTPHKHDKIHRGERANRLQRLAPRYPTHVACEMRPTGDAIRVARRRQPVAPPPPRHASHTKRNMCVCHLKSGVSGTSPELPPRPLVPMPQRRARDMSHTARLARTHAHTITHPPRCPPPTPLWRGAAFHLVVVFS